MIRILRGGSPVVPKFKSNITTSLTQTEAIKSIEIFAKDLENPGSRFETLALATNVKELYNQDILFTITKEVKTNYLVIRGVFKQITMLIYGDVVEEDEMEVTDISLESLKEDNENLNKFQRREVEDQELDLPQHNNHMLNFFRSISQIIKTPNISINTDNIRPKLLFEEKDDSRKPRNNEDIVQIIEAYTKELNKVITGNVIYEQSSKYLQHIDQLYTHIDELLKQNDGHIRLPADFNDNMLIYHSIPLSVVKICLKTFSQKYDDLTEVYHGLELAKTFLNSFDHAYDFIQGDGLERIYQSVLEKEGYVSPYIKTLALEVINMCLCYEFACDRFVNLDITQLENFVDQSQTQLLVKEKEKEKEKEKTKDKDRDESKDRSQKVAKSKSKARSNSRSRSRSKSSKKSKKRKHKDRKSKKDRSRSTSRSPSKGHGKKKSSKHKKKRESESPSESRSPSRHSRPRKGSKAKEVPSIELKINTGYQKVVNQLNKSDNFKVNYAIRQVVHKADLYCYLSDLTRTIETELLPEINRLKDLETGDQGNSFRECNTRMSHMNEIVDSISTSLENLLPIFVSQLLFNGRMVTGELKFEECVAKPFLKDKLQGVGIMTNLVTILKHDYYVISHDMTILLKGMNLLPSLALCMASDYVINSPHFETLFMHIRKLLIVILGAKGGVCFLGKNPNHTKVLLNVLEYLQKDLKSVESAFPEEMKGFNEDNMLGIFDYCEDFDLNILNSLKDITKERQFSVNRVRLGIFARQLSATLKYIVHTINSIDIICVKHMAEDYNEILLQNLTQISYIANKNRISNQALRAVMINEFAMQLMVSIMSAKNVEEVSNKTAEIALVCDIVYQVFRYDSGELSILWGEALNKTIPPISKILKDDKNQEYFKDETELRNSLTLLENYMEPIFTFSILNEKDDGVMLLLIEFNKKCRYQGPQKLGIQQKNAAGQKYNPYGLPSTEDDVSNLRDDIKYFGNGSNPNSPIVYMESALNILNIMASYHNTILIHYLEKDIFSGINMISNSLCLIIEKFLSNDTLSTYTHKILNQRNSYVNIYLRTLTKALFLIHQRMEYRLGTEENTYENMDLLQALLTLYSACFNYCQGNFDTLKQTNITKQYLILTTELIVSIFIIWSQYSAFTEVFVYELCYRYYNSIKNRSATLYLFSTILKSMYQNDKTIFNTAIKALVYQYKPRKYERKLENKDKDLNMSKERKPLPILKVHHHDQFFEDYVPHDMPVLEFLLNTFMEAKSSVFESSLETFLDAVLLRTEFKYLKELMGIFERKWKFYYENRQEYLGDDVKVKTLGMMIRVLAKISKSDEFKTYMIDKKFANDLIRILQIIEDEFYSHSRFRKLTNARRLLLISIKEAIFEVFTNLCDHDIGIIKSDNTSQDHGHLLENIPSVSEIQDMLKILVHEFNTANDLLEKLNKLRNGNEQPEENGMRDEDQEISDDCLEASVRALIKSLKIIENLGRNVVGQYILLNTEYSKIIRNPSPIICFTDFYSNLIKLTSLLSFTNEEEKYSLLIVKIVKSFLYCLYLLCYNPLNNHILNSEKRKLSLKTLLFKNKTMKVPSSPPQKNTITESLENLSSIVIEKKRDLDNNMSDKQLGYGQDIMSAFDIILFEALCLINFFNMSNDHKKESEKIYVDMDHPKEIEQKFKDIEEKEAEKDAKQPLILDIRSVGNSHHKISSQAMALIDHSLDDLLGKPNQPLLAWKKGRLHCIARDQLGLLENRISSFKYSHLNDFEVPYWDYDGSTTPNKKRLEVATALTKKRNISSTKLNTNSTFKLSEQVKNHLFGIFGYHSLFYNAIHQNLFANEINHQLEHIPGDALELDEKPLIVIKKKIIEKKPKTHLAVESYYTSAQLASQENFVKQQEFGGQRHPSNIQKTSNSSRPSSVHLDNLQNKQVKGYGGVAAIQTPTRTASIEATTPIPQIQKEESKELVRTVSETSTSMPGPSFMNQEFNSGPTVLSPIAQSMTPTHNNPQTEMMNYQRSSSLPTNNIQPAIKTGMHPGPGGPISPMSMGPGGVPNLQGPFPGQGAPFPSNQGNFGMNMNLAQGNPMQQNNMMGNMNPNPAIHNMSGMGMQRNIPGNYNNNMMNPMPGMQNFPGMMQGPGPNQSKMPMIHEGNFMINMNNPGNLQQFPGPMTGTPKGSNKIGIGEIKDILLRNKGNTPQQHYPMQNTSNEGNNITPIKMSGLDDMGNMSQGPLRGDGDGEMNMKDFQQHQPYSQMFPHQIGQPSHMHQQQPSIIQQGPQQPMAQSHVQISQENQPQPGQGGVSTGINSLTPEEKKLLKEIMKNKHDPRCRQRMKEILLQYPRIKEFVFNQNKAHQAQPH